MKEEIGLTKRLVVFAILMENNGGILGKAQSYIMEKYGNAMTLEHPEYLLDSENTRKYRKWLERWEK